MFSNPYVYQVVDFLFSVPVVEHVFTLSDSILRALAMIQVGVEGVSSNPALGADKFVAKVLCGTLAGCGGGLWIGKLSKKIERERKREREREREREKERKKTELNISS
jgi:hypothetical protein